MLKIALGIEYLGSCYHGWQRQPSVDSVQGRLELALSVIADHPVEVVCAGRTDRGVHATAQVVHFETTAQRDMHAWQLGALSHLPGDIGVSWARGVGEDFHARFSATARQYRYAILNRIHRPGLLHGRVTWQRGPLDVEAMHEAAQRLVGTFDFSSFRGKDCQARSPVRTLEWIRLVREGDYIYLDLRANAFLHHMVRNIAGTLMRIGLGQRPVAWIETVRDACLREAAGFTAPADGLYLVHVEYPEAFGLGLEPRLPVFY
ncbi:MAG: tRNA pseudouridine(38-40) synthase TruA [Halothiobacillaceae bacterium]|nr:MAG: tRNA pseudouridine(38-40) synthase TruA [Halothiobacillaceae bacterium]